MLVLQKMHKLVGFVLGAAALDTSAEEFAQVGFLLENLIFTVDSSKRKGLSKS